MKAALIEIASGVIIAIGILPFTHELADGGTALLTDVGQEVPVHAVTYRVMEYVEVAFDAPGTYFTQGADVETRNGLVITVTRQWSAWTQPQIDTYEASRLDGLANAFDDVDDIERAASLVALDQINASNALTAAILQQIGLASSLADLKTRIGTLTAIQQRTVAQMKTAIRAKIGT